MSASDTLRAPTRLSIHPQDSTVLLLVCLNCNPQGVTFARAHIDTALDAMTAHECAPR